MLEHGEPFFARHGAKAVFLGRWVAGLRIASSWLAGMNRMPWPTFLFWNALGGIAWATSVAHSIYFLGELAEHAIEVVGPVAAGIVVAALVGLWLYQDGALVFTVTGALPGAEAHDYAALVASTRTPEAGEAGAGFRGPQPASARTATRSRPRRATTARTGRASAASCTIA